MAWWRRDPSLLSHSPLHRYAQRILRDREAALRTRCFSRTPSKSAQHEDDGGRKRPSNMTNLEWMQLQHYERWRKRLLDDPYKTLFGASNDMLSGKGLKDWEWVHKSFPKWMLQEMNMDQKSQETPKDHSSQRNYPKKVEIQGDEVSSTRESHFPQPTFRSARFERDESSGIISPSDLRRPRESSHVKVVGNTSSEIRAESAPSSSARPSSGPSTIFVPPPTESSQSTDAVEQHDTNATRSAVKAARQEAAARETSFIEEFLNTKSERQNANIPSKDSKSWRQTALQRRTASELMAKPRAQPSSLQKPPIEAFSYVQSSAPVSKATSEDQSIKAMNKSRDWLIQQETSVLLKENQKRAAPPRSASEIIGQLPKDDLDFISAADIRASMGAKRSRLPTNEQRQAEREHLEKMFAAADTTPNVDSMVESKILNDQYVRRAARELGYSTPAPEVAATNPTEQPAPQVPATEAPMESNIDRMKKWLETTGASFAKQFWQDPTEEADVTKTKLFFDKAAHYLKKGQAAMRQVTEDLEKDVPAAKALLKRLKSDEEVLDVAIHRLRQRSSSGNTQGLSPRKIRAMESLKVRFHQTNTELEKAYASLDGLAGTDAVAHATGSFKRRLTAASKVLHKNAQLLRMLIWSLQARLEDPNMDRKILSNYKVVADNLLSLRDTQMTPTRLVDRAMLVYGVVPDTSNKAELNGGKTEQPDHNTCEEPFVRARLAADAHLINEIKAHKSAMQGLSDDGYSRMSKPTSSKVLDEPSPLAHSLFRPFAPAFEKLGTTKDSDLAAEKAKEEERKKLGDLQLVADVKKAYEDTYGAITVDHRQVAPVSEEVKVGEDTEVKSFAVLQEDPAVVGFDAVQERKVASKEATSSPFGVPEATSENGANNVEASRPAPAEPAIASEAVPPANEVKASLDTSATTSNSSILKDSNETPNAKASTPSIEDLPTYYTILVRDPQTDTLSITTSSTGPPRDTSPSVPLHQALSALDSPAKFIPYITEGLEVVSAKSDILVLRDALDSTASTRPFETIRTPSLSSMSEDPDMGRRTVNPIDGTTRLSPTGYVGPEESPEQLQKEFDERREAAGKFNGKESEQEKKPREEKRKRKGGAAGVVKTAIWVAGICYVVGVGGEIATAPFGK